MARNLANPNELFLAFRNHLQTLVDQHEPAYIVPLESKGTMLADICLSEFTPKRPYQIIYPRAFDYIPPNELRASNFLLLDDNFRHGTTLNKAYSQLIEKRVPDSQITMVALLDSHNESNHNDYLENVWEKLKNNFLLDAIKFTHSERRAVMFDLQDRILQDRIPLTYDHIRLTTHTSKDVYKSLLARLSESGRVLDYGVRGGYFTSAIPLDDIYSRTTWDFLPEFRLWFHLATGNLQIAPVGTPQNGNEVFDSPTDFDFHRQVQHLFDTGVESTTDILRHRKDFHARSLTSRACLLKWLKPSYAALNLWPEPESFELNRYYPGEMGSSLSSVLSQYWERSEGTELPKKTSGQKISSLPIHPSVAEIVKKLQQAYDSQKSDPSLHRKNWKQKGYSGSDLIQLLGDAPNRRGHSKEQLIAAIDCCFDMSFGATFIQEEDAPFSHVMRSTEISQETDWLMKGYIFEAATNFRDDFEEEEEIVG